LHKRLVPLFYTAAKLLSEMTGKELSQLFPIIIREHDPKYQERYENEKSVLEEIIGKDK